MSVFVIKQFYEDGHEHDFRDLGPYVDITSAVRAALEDYAAEVLGDKPNWMGRYAKQFEEWKTMFQSMLDRSFTRVDEANEFLVGEDWTFWRHQSHKYTVVSGVDIMPETVTKNDVVGRLWPKEA